MIKRLFNRFNKTKKVQKYNLRTHKYFISYTVDYVGYIKVKNIEIKMVGAITSQRDIERIERNLRARHKNRVVRVINFNVLEVQNG